MCQASHYSDSLLADILSAYGDNKSITVNNKVKRFRVSSLHSFSPSQLTAKKYLTIRACRCFTSISSAHPSIARLKIKAVRFWCGVYG